MGVEDGSRKKKRDHLGVEDGSNGRFRRDRRGGGQSEAGGEEPIFFLFFFGETEEERVRLKLEETLAKKSQKSALLY
jgi:hypothetical protein